MENKLVAELELYQLLPHDPATLTSTLFDLPSNPLLLIVMLHGTH